MSFLSIPQAGINTDAIVIWRKKLKNYSRITLMTKSQGLITCAVPHRRLMNLKGAGYLQAFNAIHATLQPAADGYYSLVQVDGIYAIPGLLEDFDKITYAAIAGELIIGALGKYEVNPHAYRLISLFSQAIKTKPIRLATIILGWQLLLLGGFVPSRRALQEEDASLFWQDLGQEISKTVRPSIQEAIRQILSYSWKPDCALNLTKEEWNKVETILYAYSMTLFEQDLQSIKFLHLSK